MSSGDKPSKSRGRSPEEMQRLEERARELWESVWRQAIERARKYGGRGEINALLKSDLPPPSVIPDLLALKGPRGAPRKVKDPERVVREVWLATRFGYPNSGDAEDKPAFVAAACRLKISPGHARELYRSVPKERKEEIRKEVEALEIWIKELK